MATAHRLSTLLIVVGVSIAAVAAAGAPAARAGAPAGAPATAHAATGAPGTAAAAVRAQVDTVGFAVSRADMRALLAALAAREDSAVAARRAALGLAVGDAWIAAIIPHDDYVYAGPTAFHVLPGLRAGRWLLFGVCHACRRLGVRDRLLFDDAAFWRVGGEDVPVEADLRARLLARLGPEDAVVAADRHAAEHSLEALVPWLRAAVPDAAFVPVLVPGMSWERLLALADRLAVALAEECRGEGWLPGRDLGLLISADAVHYGCEGWGAGGGYHPFGCDAAGHAAGVAQDVTLAQATLAGPLTDDGLERFARLVWKPGDPQEPYLITWCGLYAIPCGLAVAARLQAAVGGEPLTGHLLRYGDSVTDGRLPLAGTRLGVTAPATLAHWVGYPALGYLPRR